MLRLLHRTAEVLSGAAFLGYLFYLSWIIGIVILAIIALSTMLSTVASALSAKRMEVNMRAKDNLASVTVKCLENVNTLCQLSGGYSKAKVDGCAEDCRRTFMKYYRAFSLGNLIYGLSSQGITIITVVTAAVLVAFTGAPIGLIAAAFALSGHVAEPFLSLGELTQQIAAAKISIKRVAPFFTVPETGKSIDDIKNISVSLDKFSFGDKVLFDNFALELTPGENVCISGESGCGKSTLLKLIANQEDAGSSGAVTVNGTDVREIDARSYYKRLLYAEQTNSVFNASLRENIALGDNFSDEDIGEVLDVCKLSEFATERGLDGVLKDDGDDVSVGQKQRINVARMLIRKPEILLLDEPTSALDPETAAAFIQNLKTYGKKHGVTYVAVSHKDDILPLCDRVFRLNAD